MILRNDATKKRRRSEETNFVKSAVEIVRRVFFLLFQEDGKGAPPEWLPCVTLVTAMPGTRSILIRLPKIRKVVYLTMALTLLASPLLACTVPGATMSDEEKECCRHMADQCGDMQMDTSHGCCTKTPSANASVLQQSVKYSPAPPGFAMAIAPSQALVPQISRIAASPFDHTPCLSESPPGSISILRI